MTANPTDLLEVQRLDVEAERLRHQRVHMPQREELESARLEQGRHQVGIEEVAAGRVVVAMRQKRAEDEAQIVAQKVATDEARLYGGEVQGMKDLEALQHEIAGLRERQGEFEDAALEAMEEAESLAEQIDALEDARSSVDTRIAELESEIAAGETAIDAQIAAAEGERARVADALDASLLAEYDRLRPAFGSASAVRFDGSRCVGCPSAMPAMEVDRMKRTDEAVLSCDECGRIVLR